MLRVTSEGEVIFFTEEEARARNLELDGPGFFHYHLKLGLARILRSLNLVS